MSSSLPTVFVQLKAQLETYLAAVADAPAVIYGAPNPQQIPIRYVAIDAAVDGVQVARKQERMPMSPTAYSESYSVALYFWSFAPSDYSSDTALRLLQDVYGWFDLVDAGLRSNGSQWSLSGGGQAKVNAATTGDTNFQWFGVNEGRGAQLVGHIDIKNARA